MATYCLEEMVPRELACPICFEDYDISDPKRYPKLLLCLHTFCANCTRLLHRRDGTLECSMCRMLHRGVRLDELYDNHVIFMHLRKKLEEHDLEFARRMDEAQRDQTKDSHKNSDTTLSLLSPSPAPTPAPAPSPVPALVPSPTPAPAPTPELVLLDSSVDQSHDDIENYSSDGDDRNTLPLWEDGSSEEEVDSDDVADVEDVTDNSSDEESLIARDINEDFQEVDDMAQEENLISLEINEDFQEVDDIIRGVLSNDDDNSNDDYDDNGDGDDVDNDDDDGEDDDDDGVDEMQCPYTINLNISFTDEDIDTGFEGADIAEGIGDEEEEDGWHSASEDYSPNHWNFDFSESEEMDDNDTSDIHVLNAGIEVDY